MKSGFVLSGTLCIINAFILDMGMTRELSFHASVISDGELTVFSAVTIVTRCIAHFTHLRIQHGSGRIDIRGVPARHRVFVHMFKSHNTDQHGSNLRDDTCYSVLFPDSLCILRIGVRHPFGVILGAPAF